MDRKTTCRVGMYISYAFAYCCTNHPHYKTLAQSRHPCNRQMEICLDTMTSSWDGYQIKLVPDIPPARLLRQSIVNIRMYVWQNFGYPPFLAPRIGRNTHRYASRAYCIVGPFDLNTMRRKVRLQLRNKTPSKLRSRHLPFDLSLSPKCDVKRGCGETGRHKLGLLACWTRTPPETWRP